MKRKIALLALLAAFPPLSTDMYLAAIPLLVENWQQPLATVNLTLVCFFVTYCGFLLVYGPLSDRYGRRPPLLAGLGLYVGSSLWCAVSGSITQMILARAFQGAGAAAASAIVFAICKDIYKGPLRQRIFIQLGIIVAAAPMLAPIIGGWIIEALSWRWVFVLQAVLGVIAMTGVWMMKESLTTLNADGIKLVFKSYVRLMGNMPFLLLSLALACLGYPFFAFIASSSDIYITGLGYSEKEYGYFFACNASAFMIAPLVFSWFARHFTLKRLLPVSYLGVVAASVPLTIVSLPMPYRLAIPMWLLTFFFAFGRPPGNNLILEQIDTDVGSASAFMVFLFFMTGASAMWLVSLDWPDKVSVLGWMGIIAGAVTLTSWLTINRLHTLRYP